MLREGPNARLAEGSKPSVSQRAVTRLDLVVHVGCMLTGPLREPREVLGDQ